MPVQLSNAVYISDDEIEFTAIRAQGPGGQNVNKVSSAVQLRFDIPNSSLPPFYKERLMKLSDNRITKDGILIIKAQNFRTQEQNKDEAIQRLVSIIKSAVVVQKKRRPTKPTKASQKRRVDRKTQRGKIKALRGRVS